MIRVFEQIMCENWDNWFKTPLPGKFYFLKISGNPLLEGKVTFIVFTDRDRSPSLVIKSVRSANSIQALQKEHDTLSQLHAKLGDTSGIPIPLWYGAKNEQWFTIETALSGKLMGNMRSPWIQAVNKTTQTRITQHFTRSFQWLSDFHRKSQTGTVLASKAIIEKLLIESIHDSNSPASLSPDMYRALEYLINKITASLSGAELPLVCEHGDFWAGNIYLIKDQIGVIDWADARFSRLPVLDAAYFTVSYCLGFTPIENNKYWMFENLITKKSWFYQLATDSFRHYHQEIGLPVIDPFNLIGLSLLRRYTIESKRPKEQNTYQWMLDRWMKASLEQSF